MTTHFKLAQKEGQDGRKRVLKAIVYDEAGNGIFKLTYGQAATLLRVNHGWRAGHSKSFYVDMERGSIESADTFENHRTVQLPEVPSMQTISNRSD